MTYPKVDLTAPAEQQAAGVSSTPNFPAIEQAVLRYWDADGTFRASVAQRDAGVDGANEFVFYDGPPFANGLPHYGHLLTGYVKDIVPRFQTMRGKKVERIYHTSSGSPATPTVRGNFRFYMAQPGYNAKEMFWSKYFIRGYAIHGYKSVPVFNASHGCFRVPLSDAKSIYDWIEIGDRIDVYG